LNTQTFNPYIVLRSDKSSSQEEIKAQYRSLASKYHPDNQETGDNAAFLEVRRAWDVLGDKIRRQHYDETGFTEMKPPVEERADDALIGLFNQIMIKILVPDPNSNPITGQPNPNAGSDFIELCRDQVIKDIRTVENQIEGVQAAIDKTLMFKNRIVSAADTNAFETMLDTKAEQLEHQQAANKDTLALFHCVLKKLEQYMDSGIGSEQEAMN